MCSLPSTKEFYEGKTIFLTGATGYLGRFLIYKILKEYNVKKIYILMRAKRKQTFQDRADEFKNLELFTQFLPEKTCLSKIVALEGDICQENCGLTREQRMILSDEVDIVVHSAACIRFTAPLKTSALIHITGTHNVIELAASFKMLQIFVHMSSISAWINHDTLPESIPDCAHDPYEVADRFKHLFAHEAEKLESEFIGPVPKFLNSYAATKSFAELVVDRHRHRFKRVAIIRPPFLVSSNLEPMTGWFDTPQEGVSLSALCSFGLCRIAQLDLHQAVDALPVDLCVNALLAITWYMVKNENESNLKVFNLSIVNTTKCTGYYMLPFAIQLGYLYPSIKQIRPPIDTYHYPVPKPYIAVKSFFTHTLFALLVDFILLTFGREPMFYSLTKKKLSAVSKIFQGLAEYKGVYKFKTRNIDLLYGEKGTLSLEDRRILFYNLKKINWYAIAENGHLNFRRRVLKESDDNLPLARKRLFYITKVYQLFTFALQLLIAYTVYRCHLILFAHVPWIWPIALPVTFYLIFALFINIDSSAFTLTPRAA